MPDEAAAPDAYPSGPLGAHAFSRRNLIMGGALLAASAIGFARQPQPVAKPMKEDEFEKLIPTRIGDYQFVTSSGLVLPPPDQASESLYDQVFTRVYSAPNKPPIALLIAYSSVQNGLLQLHRPEICYPANGYALSDTMLEPLKVGGKTITTRTFAAKGQSRDEFVLYWTRLGNDMPGSWFEQRMAVVKANLRRRDSRWHSCARVSFRGARRQRS